MNIFDRPELHQTIDHFARISKIFAVIGPKGVGKSTLIRHWFQKNGIQSIKWINLQSTFSLLELLAPIENSVTSLEVSLDQYANQISQYQVVVWDDFQNLAPKHLATIVSFIKTAQNLPLQIILADEDIQILKTEMPFLNCPPLSEQQTKEYIELFLKINVSKTISEILISTGGLPYLLNLWSQFDEQSAVLGEAILPRFSELEKDQLALLYFYGPISVEHPHSTSIKNLAEKFYVKKNEDHFVIQSYLIDIVEKHFAKVTKQNGARLAIDILKTNASTMSHFSIWLIALKVDFFTEALEHQSFIDPKNLENLSKNDLQLIYHKKSIMINKLIDSPIDDLGARTLRLFLQSGILIGERKTTLSKLQLWIKDLAQLENPSIELSWLAYEIIYWHNRANEIEITKELLEKYQNKVQGELKLLMQLELAFPYTSKDPQRALLTLKRVAASINQTQLKSFHLIHAQTLLQIATCYFNLEERAEALKYYIEAEDLYQTAQQSYFEMICRINRLLLLINDLDLDECVKLLEQLFFTATRFGYNYLLSGAYYIQAIIDRENLKRTSALANIVKALNFIPDAAPPRSSHSILQEQIGILISLGQYRKAEKIFTESLKNKASVPSQIEFSDLNFEEAQDQWRQSNKNKDNTEFQRFQLLHGQYLNEKPILHLHKTPWGRWTLLENRLARNNKDGTDKEHYLKILDNMEYLLKDIPEDIPEKFMVKIFRWQIAKLHENSEPKSELDLVRSEIQNWAADQVIKAPLLAICDSLLDSNFDLYNSLDWQTSRQIDRARWIHWLLKKPKIESSNYTLLFIDETFLLKKNSIPDWNPVLSTDFDLALIEHLGMVYLKQKEIKEFHRKAVLRQLLAFILEIYPTEITKTQLANIIWGESYSPSSHDSRIYTSIQRLRQLIDPEMIESWNGGYRWNSKFRFSYVKSEQVQSIGLHKVQTLILQILQNYQKSGTIWISRASLVEATNSSESTVKRELNKLLLAGQVIRKGTGPSVLYALVGN
jgi:GTPase SAR1 family protein